MFRMNRKAVQRIKARDIVPGDVVEVAGMVGWTHPSDVCKNTCKCKSDRILWQGIAAIPRRVI